MILRKPVWEPFNLWPQHPQQQDSYHERLLAARLSRLDPYGWGVVECTIDPLGIQAGEVRVTRFDAVLPDGTVIDLEGDAIRQILPARAIEGLAGKATSVDVYVGLPQEADANVDATGNPGTFARFVRMEWRANDYNSGDNEQPLVYAQPNLRLLFGEERRDRFDAIRIAQLTRSASGSVVLNPVFVPPALRIGASPYLTISFQRLLAAMHAKAQALSQTRRQRTASLVEFQAKDAAKFWLLHTLNQNLPGIAEVVDKPHTHPQEAHRYLAELIGALCTFDPVLEPSTIPRYDHLRLSETFGPMFAQAFRLLESLIAEHHTAIPLQAHAGGYFTGKIPPELFQHAFYLAVTRTPGAAHEPRVEEIRDFVPSHVKVSSRSRLHEIVGAASYGLGLQFENVPPGALPVKPGVFFFALQKERDHWMAVVATGEIALYSPYPIQLALYAVDPSSLQ